MNREVHVRICEGPGLKCPGLLGAMPRATRRAPTHTASAFLAACLRRVSGDYQDRWGHPVLAVESFTDPARHRGTCYAAAGFTALGSTTGYARTGGGSESYTFHGQPKTYWLKPLHRHGPVSYTHLRAHETVLELVCRLLLEK